MNRKTTIFVAVIALIAISGLGLASVNAQTCISPNAVSANSVKLSQTSYIRIDGLITQWGTTPVVGTMQTQAKIATFNDSSTAQLAMSTAIWTTNTSRPIAAVVPLKQNFTYTFYEARLANASVSTLSVGNNYFLNGTWNIYTVTSKITIITNSTNQIVAVHRTQDISVQKAYGELNVTDNLSKFTLSINGINQLSGTVFASVQRQVQFNPFKVTDDSATTAVTKEDLAAIIRNYGAMPGWGNFDAKMDFCAHFKIDIADLSTAAAQM